MTKKQIRIAQGTIALVFALAVIYFIAGIVIDKKTGPVKAQERFDAIVYETRTLSVTYEPTSDAFKTAFSALFSEHVSDVIALQLYLNNQLLYNYVSAETIENATTDRKTEELKTLYGNTLSVSALLYTFQPQAVFAHARVSFVLILLGTLAAIVLLVVLQYRPVTKYRKIERIKVDESEEEAEAADNSDEVRFDNEESDDVAHFEDESGFESEAVSPDESDAIGEDDASDEDDFDPIGEMEEDNRLSAEEDAIVYADESEAVTETADDAILRAEETALASEPESEAISDFETEADDEDESPATEATSPDAMTIALGTELADAIASEQDIATLIIQLHGLTLESTACTQLKKLLTERLGKQGIVGDHNGNIALVVKNTNLDTALAFAQSLNNAISVILQRSGESAQVAIGIAARSFRAINADRLLTEAEQAALHADAENPIIAFRVNPEKYKQYVQETA